MLFAGLSMLRRARVPSSRTVAEDTELDISLDVGDTLPFESKTCTIHFTATAVAAHNIIAETKQISGIR